MLILQRTRNVISSIGSLDIKYYIDEPDAASDPSYGIAVETNGNLRILHSVLPDRMEVISIIETLYRNLVTTVTFKDVVEDYICERNLL